MKVQSVENETLCIVQKSPTSDSAGESQARPVEDGLFGRGGSVCGLRIPKCAKRQIEKEKKKIVPLSVDRRAGA